MSNLVSPVVTEEIPATESTGFVRGLGLFDSTITYRAQFQARREVPPLHQVRSTLMFEFPYALDVIDFALADLVGRTTIRLRPFMRICLPRMRGSAPKRRCHK